MHPLRPLALPPVFVALLAPVSNASAQESGAATATTAVATQGREVWSATMTVGTRGGLRGYGTFSGRAVGALSGDAFSWRDRARDRIRLLPLTHELTSGQGAPLPTARTAPVPYPTMTRAHTGGAGDRSRQEHQRRRHGLNARGDRRPARDGTGVHPLRQRSRIHGQRPPRLVPVSGTGSSYVEPGAPWENP